jgi:hypothetical protein
MVDPFWKCLRKLVQQQLQRRQRQVQEEQEEGE